MIQIEQHEGSPRNRIVTLISKPYLTKGKRGKTDVIKIRDKEGHSIANTSENKRTF